MVTLAAKVRILRRGEWKLVYQPLESGYALRPFDLESDSACKHDVSAQHPEVRADRWSRSKRFMPDPNGEVNFRFSQDRIGSKDWSASRFGVRRWTPAAQAERWLGLLQAQPNLGWG